MTPAETERLAAAEDQLAALAREVCATRARLDFLRALLAAEAPEAARAEEDAELILDAISGPSKPIGARPVLRVLEGGLNVGRPHAHGRDRHGLRAV